MTVHNAVLSEIYAKQKLLAWQGERGEPAGLGIGQVLRSLWYIILFYKNKVNSIF